MQLEQNSITGRWFYVDLVSNSSNQELEFTTMLDKGYYWTFINGNVFDRLKVLINDVESDNLIYISRGKTALYEINLDKDSDNYDLEQVGGTDCNDSRDLTHPGANETCNLIDDNCYLGLEDDGFNELWFNQVTSCGIGECADVGSFLCSEGEKNNTCIPKNPTSELCFDGKDNDCDGLTDFEDSDDCFVPEITINYPLDSSWHSNNSILLDITTDKDANCTYFISSCSWESTNNTGGGGCGGGVAQTMNITGKTSHSQLITGFQTDSIISETYGSWYDIHINCTNNQGSSKSDSVKIYLDKTKPIINSQSPMDGKIVLSGMTNFSINYTEENLEDVSFMTYVIDDKPEVELFVMSHCPYGAQAEKGIIPVFELLDDKINSEIRFVHYYIHGEEELEENHRQVCIREEEKDKYLDYLKCFLEDGNSDRCLVEMGINETINDCLLDEDYMWTSDYDSELSEVFGVTESPTLVINGEIVHSDRDSASYLETICSVFDEAPEECQGNLSSETPTPGFGSSNVDIITLSTDAVSPSNSSGGGSGGSSGGGESSSNSSGGGFSDIPDSVPSSGGSSSGGMTNIKTLRSIFYKSSCPSGIDQECSFEINLSDYVNKKIKYWFSLEDIANTITYGDVSNLEVLSGPVALNLTKRIENRTIQLKNNNSIVIEFDAINDSTNLTDLKVVRQSDENEYAYLLIFGLDLTSQNKTKTVYFDRIMNGTGICIKDEELLNISEISSSCSGTNEYWLACPGINGDYNCSLVENNTRYKISGLKHSGIKEQETYCGDGIPNGDESCSSCSVDVGDCPADIKKTSGGGGGGGSPTPKENVSVINQTNATLNVTGEFELPPNGIMVESDENVSQKGRMGLVGITGAAIGATIKENMTISVIFIFGIIGAIVGLKVWKRKR